MTLRSAFSARSPARSRAIARSHLLPPIVHLDRELLGLVQHLLAEPAGLVRHRLLQRSDALLERMKVLAHLPVKVTLNDRPVPPFDRQPIARDRVLVLYERVHSIVAPVHLRPEIRQLLGPSALERLERTLQFPRPRLDQNLADLLQSPERRLSRRIGFSLSRLPGLLSFRLCHGPSPT